MKYEIIEDCSPYYIRFTYDGLDTFNSYVMDIYENYDWVDSTYKLYSKFTHRKLDPIIGREVLDHCIISDDISLTHNRVSFFTSAPGLYYRAHKDGSNHRFSINYTLKVLDDKCVTSWYSDDDLKKYPMDQFLLDKNLSRECAGFVKENHTPVKSMVAQPNECILFNTDIFHAWDNSISLNERIVLTLRSTTPGDIYFDDAKQLLFKGKI